MEHAQCGDVFCTSVQQTVDNGALPKKKAGEMRDRDAPNDTGINVRISSGPEFTSLRPFPKLVKCHVSRPCTSKNSFKHNSWEDGIFRSIPKIDIRYFLWESFGMSMISRLSSKQRSLWCYEGTVSLYIYILTATIKSSFFSIGILFPTHPIAKPTKYQPPQEIRPSLSLNHPLNKGLVSGGGVALAGWP